MRRIEQAGAAEEKDSSSRAREIRRAKSDSSALSLMLDDELVAGEIEAVERSDNAGGEAFRLKEFAGDLLNFLGGDGFEHGDQFLRAEIPIEIDVITREAVHALTTAL